MNAVLDEVQGIAGLRITLKLPPAIRRQDEELFGMFRERAGRIPRPVRPTANLAHDHMDKMDLMDKRGWIQGFCPFCP